MLLAGVCQGVGALLLLPTFLDVPLWFRIPVQGVAVAFIVGGLVAIPVMITEVVPPTIRGIAFSVTGFLSAIAGAISPLLIGFIADQFDYVVDGEVKGNLANAFLIVTPLVLVGAVALLQGRRHVAGDIARPPPRRPSVPELSALRARPSGWRPSVPSGFVEGDRQVLDAADEVAAQAVGRAERLDRAGSAWPAPRRACGSRAARAARRGRSGDRRRRTRCGGSGRG